MNNMKNEIQKSSGKEQIPTMAFASMCDKFNISDIDDAFNQVCTTFNVYERYLNKYIRALINKNLKFKITSLNRTEINLSSPQTCVWVVYPHNIIRLEGTDEGWFVCPGCNEDLVVGDSVNVKPGREGQKKLDENNFRKIGGQYQFKFSELEESQKIAIFGEHYSVSPIASESEELKITLDGRSVEYEGLGGKRYAIYGVGSKVAVNGITAECVWEQVCEVPLGSKPYNGGYLVFSKEKPKEGKSHDITSEIISDLTPSDLMLGGKFLNESGFEKISTTVYATNCDNNLGNLHIHCNKYPELEFIVQPKQSKDNWYRIEMPSCANTDSATDPREIVYEDNAILKCNKQTIEILDKKRDEWEVMFRPSKISVSGGRESRTSLDLGQSADLDVSFDTSDMRRQIIALQTLRSNPSLDSAPFINMFRKKNGKGNWSNFDVVEPKYGWRVLADDSFNGVEEQREFVKKAISTPDFAILDGPPGTGKTTAIREIIIQLILDGKRVLVASSTNAAIDNVLERLMCIDCKNHPDFKDKLRPIRLGREEKTTDLLKEFSMESVLDRVSNTGLDEGSIKKIYLDSSNLVCGTISKVYADLVHVEKDIFDWAQYLVVEPEFDYLIMDESSKTTFQEFIVPAKLCKRWILAGDIRQLSPYTDDGAVETAIDLFTGNTSDVNIFDLTKQAMALISQARSIISHKNDNPRNNHFTIIVEDELASEINKQLRIISESDLEKRKRGIAYGQYCICNSSVSFKDMYQAYVLYVGVSVFRKNSGFIPLDSYAVDLTVKQQLNLSPYRHHYAVLFADERDTDVLFEYMDDVEKGFRKGWAEEISWRLNRHYWLRNLRRGENKYLTEIFDRAPGEFIDDDSLMKKFKRAIYTVENVIFHSILELLTVNGRDDNNLGFIQSFEPNELECRKETLRFQHRMHPDISASPSRLFYDGNLRDGQYVANTKIDYFIGGLKDEHNVWLDCPGTKSFGNVNTAEINMIKGELLKFLKWAKANPHPDGRPYEVILLTFYLKQKLEIADKISAVKKEYHDIASIKIATVDYIQGQEADIVFLSMVRNTRSIGFLDTPNRLNVAITRARHLMVFVGNWNNFAKEQTKSEELREIAGGCKCIQNLN